MAVSAGWYIYRFAHRKKKIAPLMGVMGVLHIIKISEDVLGKRLTGETSISYNILDESLLSIARYIAYVGEPERFRVMGQQFFFLLIYIQTNPSINLQKTLQKNKTARFKFENWYNHTDRIIHNILSITTMPYLQYNCIRYNI